MMKGGGGGGCRSFVQLFEDVSHVLCILHGQNLILT